MTTTHHPAPPAAHGIDDGHDTAASLLMAMVAEVIHDGTGAACPGCTGHGAWHDGGEALAA